MPDQEPTIDVVICVGPNDVGGLFGTSLRLLFENFRPLGRVFVVTPAVDAARRLVAGIEHERASRVSVLADEEVCPEAARLDPWFRQQYLKLHADRITDERFVLCLGADTLILEPLSASDFVTGDGLPVLRWFGHGRFDRHLAFERERVRNMARLLGVEPRRSLPAGDFICDVFLFDRDALRSLRAYLARDRDLLAVLQDIGARVGPDNRFGEWTLYAVYVLDVLDAAPVHLEASGPLFFRQLHGRLDRLRRDRYRCRVLHFVTEPGGTAAVLADLARRRPGLLPV